MLNQAKRDQLFLAAWLGDEFPVEWQEQAILDELVTGGLLTKEKGHYEATALGRDSLSPMAAQACRRPRNYRHLSGQGQWDIDDNLGILDWDGK